MDELHGYKGHPDFKEHGPLCSVLEKVCNEKEQVAGYVHWHQWIDEK